MATFDQTSLDNVRFYTDKDPYYYTIDNRPLRDLDGNVRKVADQMSSISDQAADAVAKSTSAVEQVTILSGQTTEALDQVADALNQVDEAVEQISDFSDQMDAMKGQLEDVPNQFKDINGASRVGIPLEGGSLGTVAQIIAQLRNGETAKYKTKAAADLWATTVKAGRYVSVLEDETQQGCQVLYESKGPTLPLSIVRIEYSPKEGQSLRSFGAVFDGLTNDYPALKAALDRGIVPTFDGPARIDLATAEDARQALETINRWQVQDKVTLYFPANNNIAMNGLINLTNPTLGNITWRGVQSSLGTSTSLTQLGGSAKAWQFSIGLGSTVGVSVGDYVTLSANSSSYTMWDAFVVGCWKVLSVASDSVTVQVANAYPSLPVEAISSLGLSVNVVKTVIRFPRNSMGLRLNGSRLGAIMNMVFGGSYDVATEPSSDGAGDGLQIGGAPDTYNTGLNESEQVHGGAIWVQRVAFVEFQGNGAQVLHGSLYGSLFFSCANSWRGVQAAGTGEVLVKGCITNGNGASGSETEAGGNLNCANSWNIGNQQQGIYAIGWSQVEGNGSINLFNLTAQLDARNGGHILADSVRAEGTTAILCNGGRILIGDSAVVAGSLTVNEAGVVVAVGASSVTGSVAVVEGSTYLQPDGTFYRASPGVNRIVYNENWQFRLGLSTIGDVSFQYAPAGSSTWTTINTIRQTGDSYPSGVGTQVLGRAANPYSNMHSRNITLTPPASVTPSANGEVMFQLTSNTALAVRVRGSDGVVRTGTITLA